MQVWQKVINLDEEYHGISIFSIYRSAANLITKLKPGDTAGVGCLVDSCLDCEYCNQGLEQHCANGTVYTYSAYEKDGKTLHKVVYF